MSGPLLPLVPTLLGAGTRAYRTLPEDRGPYVFLRQATAGHWELLLRDPCRAGAPAVARVVACEASREWTSAQALAWATRVRAALGH